MGTKKKGFTGVRQWRLMELRDRHKLSRLDMAKLIKCSESSYVNKETGNTPLLDYEIYIICNHFEVELNDIFLPPHSIKNAIQEKEVI